MMKGLLISVLMLVSLSSWSCPYLHDKNPRDSASVAERKQAKQVAKIERQRQRIMHKWDERSMQKKRADRRVIIFLAISAGVLASTIGHKE